MQFITANPFIEIIHMKTLYVDNYKGFTNTVIPLTDVNFFVGENSTGKTAILNLINILSDPSFWIIPEFNNSSVELGYFNEIVNQLSPDKHSFRIAIEFDVRKGQSQRFWMEFKNQNGLPKISSYMTMLGQKTVYVELLAKSAKYQVSEVMVTTFEEWIKLPKTFNGERKRVSVPKLPKNIPFGVWRSIIETEIDGDAQANRSLLITPFNGFLWLAPIRAKAKRTYDAFKQSFSSEGEHTPNMLRTLLSSKNYEKNHELIDSLIEFGKESRLFDMIRVDEYGKGAGSPFSINIEYDSLPVRITNVGYGVSQVLPLIVEILTTKREAFAIQQPEVHLHPKAQAVFGEFVYKSALKNKNRFLIETHSDFTINRFRYNLFKSEEKGKINGQVLFFERCPKGTRVVSLPFNDKGQYPDDMPLNYSNFYIDEELKMLEF